MVLSVPDVEVGTDENADINDLRDMRETVRTGHDCELAREHVASDSVLCVEETAMMGSPERAKQPAAPDAKEERAVQGSHNSMAKVAFASTVGNVLEWYDFGVFAFLAPQIGDQFFPKEDRATSIMNAFIVFGGAFVIRPLGGALFGHFGDRYGRKAALQISVAMMGASTFIIGCLPTYAQIGALAPLLLTVCRLFQGLSVGGEFVGSLIYAVESAPPNRKVFFGSLCTSSAVAGTTLGSWTGLLLHSVLTEHELLEYGWRIPFWCGLAIGGFALWMRRGLGESGEFAEDRSKAQAAKAESSPLIQGLRQQPVSILLAFLIAAVYGFGVWFISTFPPVLYLDLMDPPLGGKGAEREERRGGDVMYHGGSDIWLLHTLVLCAIVAAIPMWGWLGDRLGNQFMMASSTLALAVASLPCAIAMGSGAVTSSLLGQTVLSLIIACIGSSFPSYLVQVFPVGVRYSCLAVGYNGALGLFGGTAGIVGTYLFNTYGSTGAIGAYMAAVASVSCVSVLIQNARYKRDQARDAALGRGQAETVPAVVVDLRQGTPDRVGDETGGAAAASAEEKMRELERAVEGLQREGKEAQTKCAALAAENEALRARVAQLEERGADQSSLS